MDDMYLSLAIELYENGTWSKDVFIKKVSLHAKEKNMDMVAINELIDRVTKTKEYTITEKRRFLSVLTISGNELKYGDVVNTMSDEMIEKFYKMEEESLDKDKIEVIHKLANSKVEEKNDELETTIEDVKTENNEEVIPNLFHEPEALESEVIEEKEELDGNINEFVSVSDIANGKFTADDLLGKTMADSDALFDKLVKSVSPMLFSEVASSLETKMGPLYTKKFREEWNKVHQNDIKVEKTEIENEVFKMPEIIEEVKAIEPSDEIVDEPKTLVEGNNETNLFHTPELLEEKANENKVDETTSNWMDAVIETLGENKEETKVVVPEISFDSYSTDDMPKTEEEYKKQVENITKTEEDSSVKEVSVSKERLEKLKKSKGKIINYFLKTAIVVGAVTLLSPTSSITLVGGYFVFANMIKKDKFNPENLVGKAIKSAVEKVMYMGMNKEEIEYERGKTR